MFLTEPYAYKGHVTNVPTGLNGVYLGLPFFLKKEVNFIPILISRDIIVVNTVFNDENYLLICVYCSPSEELEENLTIIERILEKFRYYKTIINGDFNAKSPTWGQGNLDGRGRKLPELIYRMEMDIVNTMDSPPTFDSDRGKKMD
ncbi:hypothetical protein AVEN_15546-1 [Araneus ventricosus]|uniref:Endonuclease/exonuclease/phosphatase domain-containing protein n=1 Tax=Araneus ventricosus TaxID=182803 RepID=A0A4Y2IVX2_ARAVE|nr:hypothetical protein AVEN_15546-1 [Araneus ventricosus]